MNKLMEIAKDLEVIVNGQTQVRTNKLKPLVKELLNEVNNYELAPEPVNKPPLSMEEKLDQFLLSLNDEERTRLGEKFVSDDDLKTENKYLRRKQTMYDLKIENLKNEIKDLKGKK